MRYRSDIYVWMAGGEVHRISPGDGIYYQACIHPDGSDVVYSGNRDGPPQIWRADVATGSLKSLTTSTSGARHPAYGADGSKIVFTSGPSCPVAIASGARHATDGCAGLGKHLHHGCKVGRSDSTNGRPLQGRKTLHQPRRLDRRIRVESFRPIDVVDSSR